MGAFVGMPPHGLQASSRKTGIECFTLRVRSSPDPLTALIAMMTERCDCCFFLSWWLSLGRFRILAVHPCAAFGEFFVVAFRSLFA